MLQTFVTWLRNRFTSDIDSVPGPPLSIWKRYTVGHNILHQVYSVDALTTADLFNTWRKEYGPLFEQCSIFGERGVVVTSEDSLRSVTITKNSSFVKPAAVRDTLAPTVGENGLLLAEGKKHARLRRAVAPSMHHDALTAVGDIFLEQGKLLGESLAKMGETGGDILQEARNATFSVIFQTCFGKHAARPEEIVRLREAYHISFDEPPLSSLRRAILMKVFWFVNRDHFTYREDLKTYIRSMTLRLCEEGKRSRDSSGLAGKSLLSLMVDEESKQSLANVDMVDTVLSFLAAGQITTSLSVVWTIYLLARNQEWQNRLVSELNNWTEEDGLNELNRLPLLDRIVKESVRLYPPVLFVSRMAVETVTLDGFRIPKGTIIRIPVLALHRNEDIWGPDVNEFNPDRYLREGLLARTKFFWCVFMFGPRSCIGQRFALLEVKAFVAQVVKKQRAFLKPLEDSAPSFRTAFATPIGMKVYFEDR